MGDAGHVGQSNRVIAAQDDRNDVVARHHRDAVFEQPQ